MLVQKNYRLYFFLAAVLILCIFLELLAVRKSYGIPTILLDSVFLIFMLLLGYQSRRDPYFMNTLGAVCLGLWVIVYCWRTYVWFDSSPNFYSFDEFSNSEGRAFMLLHFIKALFGGMSLMIQVAVFGPDPE
jgi:hypothetical protein